MTITHVLVWLDHHSAKIFPVGGATAPAAEHLAEHSHHTRQHGSAVRSEHEFYGAVCDALEGAAEVLVAGSSTARTDFRHYLEKHRPQVAQKVLGYESVDSPTDGQLVALGRRFFAARAVGAAAPAAGP
ncbi:MAG: hypothetical protein K8R60_13630 [Burkholderiales bacterium]|nr:hypothetical protein [Burkholderiales bacterium]